jgi:uncharacterized low-complexity protein
MFKYNRLPCLAWGTTRRKKGACCKRSSHIAKGISSLHAAENPFSITQFESGYTVAAGGTQVPEWAQLNDTVHTYGAKTSEGKCGEGKCGANKVKAAVKSVTEGKCGEGKCGADKVKSAVKSVTEGKCGEGKCGGNK